MNLDLNTEPKSEAELDREERKGMFWAIIVCLLFYGGGFSLIFWLCSCTLTVSPDGTRAYGADGEQIGRALVVLSQK